MQKKDLRTRRFVAKYIKYLTVFGYVFVALMAVIVAVLWFVEVDEVVSGGEEIRPREESVKHDADAVVLKVLVANHADVMAGQVLVEISDDPEWVKRYRSARENASEGLEEMRGGMPRNDELRAPFSGAAVVGKDLVGRIIPAGRKIVKVIDFNDLSITAEVGGTNVIDIRAGQRVKVEPLPTYGDEEILRSDVDYPGWWRNGRAQFNTVGKGKIKEILQAYLAEKTVTLKDEEDTPFRMSNVKSVELQGVLRVAEPPAGQDSEGVEAEPFIGTMLTGYVHEATHTASIKIRDLPDSVRSEIEQTLLDRFRTGVRVNGSALSAVDSLRSEIEWPLLERLRNGLRVDDSAALTVIQIEDLKAVVNVDAIYKASDESVRSDEPPLPAEKMERKCWVVVKLDDLPPGFTAKVRKLALTEKPSYIPAALKVVVGARRIAMLLFRKG